MEPEESLYAQRILKDMGIKYIRTEQNVLTHDGNRILHILIEQENVGERLIDFTVNYSGNRIIGHEIMPPL